MAEGRGGSRPSPPASWHSSWPESDRVVQWCMNWLAEDLYRERPHPGGYAMENPPGNIRVEFDRVSGERVVCRATVNGTTVETDAPSPDWLDEVLP